MSGSGNVSAARIRTSAAMGGAGSARSAVKSTTPKKVVSRTFNDVKSGVLEEDVVWSSNNYGNSDLFVKGDWQEPPNGKSWTAEQLKPFGLTLSKDGKNIIIPKGTKFKVKSSPDGYPDVVTSSGVVFQVDGDVATKMSGQEDRKKR